MAILPVALGAVVDIGSDLAPLVLGVVAGVSYAALGAALLLIYRYQRVINLALVESGSAGSVFLAVAVTRWDWPYWTAFPVAVAIATGTGMVVSATVVARLKAAPSAVTTIATLGVGQILFFATGALGEDFAARWTPIEPPGFGPFEVGGVLISSSRATAAVLVPLALFALAAFLVRSRWGRAIRAAAVDPDLARANGLSPTGLSNIVWGFGSALAAVVATLMMGGDPSGPRSMGPWFLARGLAAAFLAGKDGFKWVLPAGLGIGLAEHLVSWQGGRSGARDVALLLLVVAAAALRKDRGRGRAEGARWLRLFAFTGETAVRHRRYLPLFTALLVAGALPLASPTVAARLTFVFVFAIAGLSVFILTGLGGELSLSQFAIAALGGLASIQVTTTLGNFGLGLAAAAIAGAGVGVVLAIISARSGSMGSVVVSLAFAVAASSWILERPGLYGEGVDPGQPVIGSWALTTAQGYVYFALGVLLVAYLIASAFTRSQLGRSLVAQRDNRLGALAFGVSPFKSRLWGHSAAGAVAGLAGSAFVHSLSVVTPSAFPVGASFDAVAVGAVGGLGSILGPVLGAFYISGLPAFLSTDSAFLATTSAGWLLIILAFPGGLAQSLRGMMHQTPPPTRSTVRRDPQAFLAPPSAPRKLTGASQAHVPNLEVRGVSLTFAGTAALDNVSLTLDEGSICVITGPNGSGKTALLDVVNGFHRHHSGAILRRGADITSWPADLRARQGMVRSFDDARLFASMTVLDVVKLSAAPFQHSRSDRSRRGLRLEKKVGARAGEIVDAMNLTSVATRRVGLLSTGTRRILDLTCALVREPDLLLLDEPTAGLAQAEIDALTASLARALRELGVSALIVEHDQAFASHVADTIVWIEEGKVVSVLTPAQLSGVGPR